MPEVEEVFSDLFKKKDSGFRTFKPGDISLQSKSPFGIPSGIPELDITIGRFGLPAAKVIEYFGFEASGKTSAALNVISQCQLMGGGALFIDTERSWDEERATQLGVDVDLNIAIGEADDIESVFRQIEATLDILITKKLNKPFIIVVDSITGVTSEALNEGDFGREPRVGQEARIIRQGIKRINPKIAKSRAIVIFINHAISKIAATRYAKQSESSGGHSLKFFSSVRCAFRNAGEIRDTDKKRLGMKVGIKVEKLKGSKLEYPEASVNLLNDTGFDIDESLLEAAIRTGYVDHTKGSKSYYIEEREFPRVDWPSIVLEHGGTQKFYREFLDWALEAGKIKKWSE